MDVPCPLRLDVSYLVQTASNNARTIRVLGATALNLARSGDVGRALLKTVRGVTHLGRRPRTHTYLAVRLTSHELTQVALGRVTSPTLLGYMSWVAQTQNVIRARRLRAPY